MKMIDFRISVIFLLIGLAGICVHAGSEQPSIAVLNFKSSQVPQADLVALADLLTTNLSANPSYRVIGWNDVARMLEHQAGLQALGCDSSSCMVQIGGAIGVDYIVSGSIGLMGNRFILNVILLDIKKAEAKSRVSRTVTGDVGLFIDEIPAIASALLSGDIQHEGIANISTRAMESAPVARPEKNGMILVPRGTFVRGSNLAADEKPMQAVVIDSFYLDKFEVTQEQFKNVMGTNPSKYKNDIDGYQCPVEQVTWSEAAEYCRKVGKRLPTEAEWEYACRAGTTAKFYWGNEPNGDYAWTSENSGYSPAPHPVGQKLPNAWGLFDMSGNVQEWCWDFYDRYPPQATDNPSGPLTGHYRVVRGGSASLKSDLLRSSARLGWPPDNRSPDTGFRCASSIR